MSVRIRTVETVDTGFRAFRLGAAATSSFSSSGASATEPAATGRKIIVDVMKNTARASRLNEDVIELSTVS
jgi:hypothetical protein